MSSPKIIYFDHNATTRVAPEVLEAMLPFLTEHWGNPSSSYGLGQEVAKQLESAREKVAALIGCDPRELVFTSCGTESNNTAIRSALDLQPDRRHVVMTAVEHSANVRLGEFLSERGYSVNYLPVNADGALDLQLLERSLRPDTAIVSVMWANNETGVLFPVGEVAKICRRAGVLLHTDAVQAAGKMVVDVKEVEVDLLSLSGHKLYAPKGIGALFVRRGTPFQPYLIGGQQERGRRAGTENVAAIAGFGRAAELAANRLAAVNTDVRALRDRLEDGILQTVPGTQRNGAKEPRLPNTSHLSFEDVEAEAVLIGLDRLGICASSGSACKSGSLEPSHVLRAMGLSARRARGSVRFSLGVENTGVEVDTVLNEVPELIKRLRALTAG